MVNRMAGIALVGNVACEYPKLRLRVSGPVTVQLQTFRVEPQRVVQ
jgi:hypothetical protein